ncbi:MAG: DUF1893 domain-containing protein [Lachnospiraceae bacterium]|nr:DUF1893 domain-containing protein [Lachnospiraceae bacterium]
MNKDLVRLKETLLEGGYTCVVQKEEQVYTSKARGVKPLLTWLDTKIDMKDAFAVDKVVGNGAAMLYVLLGVKELYALTLSKPAKDTLEKYRINVQYDVCVEGIRNRAGDGPCPMETAVRGIEHPEEAKVAMEQTLRKMYEK